jgi:hypothetical protein
VAAGLRGKLIPICEALVKDADAFRRLIGVRDGAEARDGEKGAMAA